MAIIGRFTTDGEGYVGALKTLTLNVKGVRLAPCETTEAKEPDFRVSAAGFEIGAGWKKTSRNRMDYITVKLDDPSFTGPIYANLIAGGKGFDLVWTRRARRAAVTGKHGA